MQLSKIPNRDVTKKTLTSKILPKLQWNKLGWDCPSESNLQKAHPMPAIRQPTLFLSHGGGPWPWLMEEMPFHEQLNGFLKALPSQLAETPRALLVISGHWEEAETAIMSGAHPPMIYDYGGFPEHTYHIQYPAPGDPTFALRVQGLLSGGGIPAHLDPNRGFDHGAFTIAYPMYPHANIPMVQLSLKSGYDPEFHLRLGNALAPLRDEGILIIGSGLSYHNMRGFQINDRGSNPATEQSRRFDDWLTESLVNSSSDERRQRLLHWERAPEARAVHPQEDHLIPLMVAAGAAENDKATRIYNELFRGVMCSSFRFG